MWRAMISFFSKDKENDISTQRILFKMFHSKILQAVYYIVKDHALAEDIAQETFEKAYKNIHTLKDESKAEAWFIRIAKRTAIDYLRKRSKERDILSVNDDHIINALESNDRSVQDEVEKRSLMENLNLCLNKIKPEHRRLLKMKYLEGMTYEEMALELQTTQGAIREALSRARKKVEFGEGKKKHSALENK
jgi:RNA polymerase sigma factor (sigma-70 family)